MGSPKCLEAEKPNPSLPHTFINTTYSPTCKGSNFTKRFVRIFMLAL